MSSSINKLSKKKRFKAQKSVITPPKIPMLNIIQYVADLYGCYQYRALNFSTVLNEYNGNDCKFNYFTINRFIQDVNFYKNTSVVIFQRASTEEHYKMMLALRKAADKLGFLLVYELDDLLFEIPKYNYFANNYYENTKKWAVESIKLAHCCITTTEYLKNRLEEFNPNVHIIENYLADWLWKKNLNEYQQNDKLNILWQGSGTHHTNKTNETHDLSVLVEVYKKTREKYNWTFMGSAPADINTKADNVTIIPWNMNHSYPMVIQSLNIDIGIGALVENNFNRAKSNIKRKEYIACGIPSIYATFDQSPYEDACCTYKHDSVDELLDNIEFLESPINRKALQEAEELKSDGNLFISDNIDKIVSTWKNCLNIK